jgi:hypothetical protein
MIDLDLNDFTDKEKLDKHLKKTLKMLSIKFNEESYPTVLWTGNGYHIYQPIEGIVFEKYEIFYDFMPNIDSKNLTTEFLRFAENLFTKGKADPNHRPSIKSCLVRVPGTFNSKNGQQVQVIQRWNGKRPAIQWITSDFRDYLIQKRIYKIKEKNKKKEFYSHKILLKNKQIDGIMWIEKLLQTPIDDDRKHCLWRVLCPYLINIRKLTNEDATIIINEWLQKCDRLRKLDDNMLTYLKNLLKNVGQFLPPSKEKLKNKYTKLYHTLKAKNIFAD